MNIFAILGGSFIVVAITFAYFISRLSRELQRQGIPAGLTGIDRRNELLRVVILPYRGADVFLMQLLLRVRALVFIGAALLAAFVLASRGGH